MPRPEAPRPMAIRKDPRSKEPQGPTQRQLRAGELVRHALVEILRAEEINDPAWCVVAGLAMYSAKLKTRKEWKRTAPGIMGLVYR